MHRADLERIVSAALAGNKTAFKNLYDISSSRAYYAALSVTKNENDAVNIMQSSYAIMKSRLSRLKYPIMFENWFYRIVCKCICDHIRSGNASFFAPINNFSAVEFDDELDVTVNDSIPGYVSETDKVTVTKILERLPSDKRLCFLMYYYFKMSIQEISKVLSVDEVLVMYYLHNSKNLIKLSMKDSFSSSLEKNIPVMVFFSNTLCSCSSHVPFKATDMIVSTVFSSDNSYSVNSKKTQFGESSTQNQKSVNPDSESTVMYASEEMEHIMSNGSNRYGKESSKGGNGEDDIPAARSASTIVKIVIGALVAVVFIVALFALVKNIVSNNESSRENITSSITTQEQSSDSYTSATVAETTERPTETTVAPTTTSTTTPTTALTTVPQSEEIEPPSDEGNEQENDTALISGDSEQ